MSLCRHLARRVPEFRLQTVPGAIGARQGIFRDFSSRRWRAYCGPIIEHVLIVVEAGVVAFERDGVRWEAHHGDALLLSAGGTGRLEFSQCRIRGEVAAGIFVFDERSVAEVLRQFSAWENLALEEELSPSAMLFRHFDTRFDVGGEWQAHSINRFQSAISTMLSQYRAGLGGFLRDFFYWKRWMVAIFMERFVTVNDGARKAAIQYAGGTQQLRKDCLLYLGAEPKTVLARRRCELALAWLRCGHSVDEVAKALGYSSRWEFECEFSGATKRRCRDIQRMTPLSEAPPEQLVSALLPFWWSDDLTILIERPTSTRIFPDSMMSEWEERKFVETEPSSQEHARQNCAQRDRVKKELRERAAKFFAMDSTGSEAIVPIFKFAKPQEMAA